MPIPVSAFLLFFGVFWLVAVILIAKIRSNARTAANSGKLPLPTARVNGTRLAVRQRLQKPGAYAYGLGVSAVLSAATCGVLALIARQPTPAERRPYRIVNPFDGTAETRELTEKELNEQYKSGAEVLENLRAAEPSEPAKPASTGASRGFCRYEVSGALTYRGETQGSETAITSEYSKEMIERATKPRFLHFMCPGELTLIFYQNREMTWDDVSFEQVVEFPMGSAGKTIAGSLAKKGSFISLSEKGTFKVTKLDATGFTGSFEFDTEDKSGQPLYVKGEFDLPCPQPKKCSDIPGR